MHTTRLAIYRFICEFNNMHRTAPSYRDVARAVGCSVQNVLHHVQALIAEGYLEMTEQRKVIPALCAPNLPENGYKNGKARRAAILHFARAWQAQFGQFPTYAQIAEGVGLNSPDTVRYHLWVLEREGKVRRSSPTRWTTVRAQSDANTKLSE